MLELKLSLGRNSVGSIKLNNWSTNLSKNLGQGMRKAGVTLQGQIKRNVTGPSATVDKSRTMPGSVTGRLRGSVTYRPGTSNGLPSIRIGPNTVYAAIHEFGGRITQTVTAKQQRFLAAAKQIYVKVAATLNIDIPKRPYVWPAWLKQKDKVMQQLQDSIMKPIR